jgi:homoserine O-acetyltransferase
MDVADRLYAGYGEDAGGGMRGGKQGKIFDGGNAYLDREFPGLDKLNRATVTKR